MKAEFHLPTFIEFAEGLGGQPLTPTNPYEAYRYLRDGSVGIVYRNDRNERFQCVGKAELDYKIMLTQKPLQAMGATKRAASHRRLILRDGNECWYCAFRPLPNQLLTIEHLLARRHGGNHKIENLALACQPCNVEADDLPITQKVRLREIKRGINQ